jgi:hypothetical protein
MKCFWDGVLYVMGTGWRCATVCTAPGVGNIADRFHDDWMIAWFKGKRGQE